MTPNTLLLDRAYAIQNEARAMMADRSPSAALEARMLAWMKQRRQLATTEITMPLEALIVAHHLGQSASVIPTCAAADDGSLNYLTAELLEAIGGLITYLEAEIGCSRSDLGIHEDFCGPVRN